MNEKVGEKHDETNRKVFETFIGDCLFENVTRFLFKKDGSVKAFDFYKMKYYM